MVCAWKLGEVFFTSCAFIALGLALRARFSQPLAAVTAEGLRGVNSFTLDPGVPNKPTRPS